MKENNLRKRELKAANDDSYNLQVVTEPVLSETFNESDIKSDYTDSNQFAKDFVKKQGKTYMIQKKLQQFPNDKAENQCICQNQNVDNELNSDEHFAMQTRESILDQSPGKQKQLQPPSMNQYNSFESLVSRRRSLKNNNVTFDQKMTGIKQKFKPYREIIENLTNSFIISTDNKEEDQNITQVKESSNVIECTQSQDSNWLILILQQSDELYKIRIYETTYFNLQHEIILGNKSDEDKYIKAQRIIQNHDSSVYCVPYLEDGLFKLCFFDSDQFMFSENVSAKLNLLDHYVKPNDNFPNPMIDGCFIDIECKSHSIENQDMNESVFMDEKMLINVFLNHQNQTQSFIYDYKTHEMIGQPITHKLKNKSSQSKNFPLSNFFDDKRGKVVIVYRQGECITIDILNMSNQCKIQVLTEQNFGQALMYSNNVLILQSSMSIDFYHLQNTYDETTNGKEGTNLKWEMFDQINKQGFVYMQLKSSRFQVVTEKLIFFYQFVKSNLTDKHKHCLGMFKPEHISTIVNFLHCTGFLTGSQSKRCIAFKYGMPDITVFFRKYRHDFMQCIDTTSKEHVNCQNIPKHNMFIVSDDNFLFTYCSECFSKINVIKVKLANQRSSVKNQKKLMYEMEILSMVVSKDQKYLGVMTGVNQIKELEDLHQIVIYEITDHKKNIFKQIMNYDLPKKFSRYSKTFLFDKRKMRKTDQGLLLLSKLEVVLLDFSNPEQPVISVIYTYTNPLRDQPDFAVFDEDQRFGVVASIKDALWFRMDDKELCEVDLDKEYNFCEIKCLHYYEGKFYLLANKQDGILGYYLLELEANLKSVPRFRYVIKWVNKLIIGDGSIDIFHPQICKGEKQVGHQYNIILAFKTIYHNQYTIYVFRKDHQNFNILYKMDNYQLWESKVKGFLSSMNNDFIILNKEGINFIRLDPYIPRKSFKYKEGTHTMVHSLSSMDYLKVDKLNMLYFENKLVNKNTMISIQQQSVDRFNNVQYEEIFKINLESMQLQDLILIQCLFLLDTSNEILQLIEVQPNKQMFLKSFMELDHANMVQILSFESRIIKKLLDNFDDCKFLYPLFYQMQQNINNKTEIMNPVQVALESNQIIALNKIIEYVVVHQNHYCFSFLFESILLELLNKGIKVTALFESNIFCHQFEMEDWPAISLDSRSLIVPYNGSKFQLKGKFEQLFQSYGIQNTKAFLVQSVLDVQQKINGIKSKKKFYKIRYILNMLPAATYENDQCKNVNDLMESLGATSELSIFDTKIVKDFYQFQWDSYAKHIHHFGGLIHFLYLGALVLYVNEVYLHRQFEYRLPALYMMLILNLYPMFYDGLQLIKQGPTEYFKDQWNFIDQTFIWFGIANVCMQRFIPDILNPASKILMIIQTLILMTKSFFFFRVFSSLSFLVSMIKRVVTDLSPFIFIYGFMLLIFSLTLGIIDWGNYEFSDDPVTRNIQQTAAGPDKEYMMMGKLFVRIIAILRISIGDFGFDATHYMDQFDKTMYWIMFLIICTMTCIIFMNFIIAEVSSTYQNVKDTLHVQLLQERGQLINEAEDMIRARFPKGQIATWTHLFPRYIIKRELDE